LRFRDVAGLAAAKAAIDRAVVWPRKYGAAMRRFGILPASGVLLYGPPGVGKTLLARATAAEAGAAFYELTPANVVSALVGASERAVSRAFRAAKRTAPSIIFIDEFDSLFPARSGAEGKVGASLVTSLVVALDDLARWRAARGVDDAGVVVLAASNRPGALDQALIQHGRFDFEIHVQLPDRADRCEHVDLLLLKARMNTDQRDRLVDASRGFSGAEI
ncbi:P-loop containing nucleoside triphosphate hydrolase protein, partial [Pelagophyceae sp. CCMP2097]